MAVDTEPPYYDFHANKPELYDDYSEKDEEEDTEEEDELIDEDKVPRLLYNKSLLLPCLPCFIFLLSLTGKWYLFLIALMALFVYLLDLAEEKQKSVTVTIVCIFISQLFVIYSVSPLIWSSMINVVLVLVTNIYAVLTGGWILLQFSYFIRAEYALARALELALFTLYPVVCCGMMTWWLAGLTHVQLAPYYFTFIGFILLQLFLSPAPSSFGARGEPSCARADPILEPEMVATLVSGFVLGPSTVYVVQGLHADWAGFLDISSLGTLVFITMTSLFLATHLNVRTFIDHFVLEPSVIVYARWLSGIGCLLTMGVLVRSLNLSTLLLPWLPFAAALHVTMGCALSYKKTQKFSVPSAFTVLLFYSSSLYLMTAAPTVHGLSVVPVYSCLLVTVVLVLAAAVLMASPLYIVLANTCLVTSLMLFTLLEVVLYCADLYSIVLCCVTCAICAYIAPRLHHVDKLTAPSCQIILTLSVSKLLVLFQYRYLPLVGSLSWVVSVATTSLLVCLMIRFVFFTQLHLMGRSQILSYILCQSALLFLCAPTLLNACYKAVLDEYATYSMLLVLFFLCVGVCGLKLTLSHQCPLVFRNHAPALIIASIVALLTQPKLVGNFSCILDLWFVAAVIVLVHGLLGSFTIKRLSSLATMALIIGLPVGNKITELVHASHRETLLVTCVCVSVWVCALFTVLMMRYTEHKLVTRRLVNISILQTTLWSALICLEIQRTPPSLLLSSHVVRTVLLTCLLPAAACKLYAISGKTLVLHRHVTEDGAQWLPLAANMYTILGFLLACAVCPVTEYWDVWCCACCLILLLLHRDDWLLPSLYRTTPLAGPALTAMLLLLLATTLQHNIIWNNEKLTFLNVVQGLLELLSIVMTMPNMYMFLGILWRKRFWVNERFVVFLAPFVCLQVYGGSYQAWVLGLFGLFSNSWMIANILPLVPDKIVVHRARIMKQKYYRR